MTKKSDVISNVDFENKTIIIDSQEALIEWFGWPRGEITLPEPKQLGVVRVFEKGSKVTMLFHGFGEVSEEEYSVVKVEGDIITLDTDEEPAKCYRFDTKTGRCLNDNTYMGCKRTLKLD